ncbi:Ig-like domain-containing protein [Longimicrobium sp.]|jgi:hypothetical protein|uniref:Ig-like domain-containing protein n=1 Tax=Longimicrobium sp. TaxID=2029185 RepID=UPI002ED88750
MQPRLALVAAAMFLAACDIPSGAGHGPPTRLSIVSGDGQQQTAGSALPEPLVVRVTDPLGRPVPGTRVSFRAVSGGGTLAEQAATTDRAGNASVRWILGTVAAEPQRVSARVQIEGAESRSPRLAATFEAVARAGDAATLYGPSPDAVLLAIPGSPVRDGPHVTVVDQHGNAVAGVTVTWSVLSGGGTLSASSTQTGTEGTATVAWTLGASGAQALQATAGTLGPVRFNARLQLPSTGQLTGPDMMVGGQVVKWRFEVRDYSKIPIPNFPVEWALGGSGGTLTAADSHTGPDGWAEATVMMSERGSFTLDARAGAVGRWREIHVNGGMSLVILKKRGSQGYANSHADASALIRSAGGGISAARFTLSGRSTAMKFLPPDPYNDLPSHWSGSIAAYDLPMGHLPAQILATDASGNIGTFSFTILNETDPVVRFVEPASSNDTVTATGSLRVVARCVWFQECTQLQVRVPQDAHSIERQGPSQVAFTLDLPRGPATVGVTVTWHTESRLYAGMRTLVVKVPP